MSEPADVPATAPEPSLLVRIKTACLAMSREYHDTGGVGTDDYWKPPMAHAMADAKFLAALVALHDGGIINDGMFNRAVTAAVRRLEASAVPGFGGGIAWGLNFGWGAAPEDEAYVITTALVLRALRIVAVRVNFDAGQEGLLKQGARSMLAWPRGQVGDLRLPLFSAHMPRPVYNAAVEWLAFLHEASLMGAVDVSADGFLCFFRNAYRPGYGWVYEAGNTRADLLHNAYMLHGFMAMSGAQAWEKPLLQIATTYAGDAGCWDAFDILDWESGRQRAAANLRFCDGFVAVQLNKPSRAWSMGELLLCLADAMRQDVPAIRALARRVAREILDRFFPPGPSPLRSDGQALVRHTTHLLHGLAAFLKQERLLARADRIPAD